MSFSDSAFLCFWSIHLKGVFKVLGVLFLLYLAMALLLAGCQRKLIYHPARASEAKLLHLAEGTGMMPWRDQAGTIIGWKAHARGNEEKKHTVVVFHGNAGFSLHRQYFVHGFQGLPGSWNVYLFEYPGYGSRAGSPTEKGIKQAAREAIGSLIEQTQGPLILVGESLGGGVASHLAATYSDKVDGLLLITPFTSLVDVGKAHYPVFPVGLLLREHYNSTEALTHFKGPTAILLAEEDEVVPAHIGQKLYDDYEGHGRLWVQEGRTHNTIDYQPDATWWRETTDFLLQHP